MSDVVNGNGSFRSVQSQSNIITTNKGAFNTIDTNIINSQVITSQLNIPIYSDRPLYHTTLVPYNWDTTNSAISSPLVIDGTTTVFQFPAGNNYVLLGAVVTFLHPIEKSGDTDIQLKMSPNSTNTGGIQFFEIYTTWITSGFKLSSVAYNSYLSNNDTGEIYAIQAPEYYYIKVRPRATNRILSCDFKLDIYYQVDPTAAQP